MLIVAGLSIMPDNIVANQEEKAEPEIWLGGGLG